MNGTATTERPRDLEALDALVGTWRLSGDTSGTVRYEWMEGGFFLLQHIDIQQGDQRTVGLEVIGHLRPYEGEPSADIRSRYYGSGGDTLDYTYEVDGKVLTIWFGERGVARLLPRGVLGGRDGVSRALDVPGWWRV